MFRKAGIKLIYYSLFLFVFERCAYNDISVIIDCDTSTLAIELVSKQDATGCKSIDGSITVTATGGVEPYDFNINGGEYQTGNLFTDLGSGTYNIRVKDMNNCWKSLEVVIGSESDLNGSVSTSADDQCSTDNGTATVSATGGTPPYEYQIDAKGFGSVTSFTNLKNGPHTIIVRDSEGCQTTLGVVVNRGNTGISFAISIKDILTTNCNLSGCHGTGTGTRDWTNFDNVKSHAANIKTRTSNRSMPPADPLTQNQIDLIACWVDDGAPDN